MNQSFDRRLTAARDDLAAEHLRGIVPAQRYVPGRRHMVAWPSVPLRPEPTLEQGIDTELICGDAFTVYDAEREGWAWGQAEGDGYVGWLPAAALGPADPIAVTHRVVALRTFVYPAPTIKQPIALALPFGAQITALEENGRFVRTAQGFLWAGHLAPVGHREADPVTVAERFLGTPYLWGGRTSLGLDCSALVQTALHACGLPCPRDSDMQEGALGAPIDPDEPLRRGDLVFWRGHVGLMRDADTLLHANGQTMDVALESIADARHRIATSGGGAVTAVRRLGDPLGQ